ncbi:hypothetical protein, partial [Paracoccus sp. (in: a-proteobacteria)]|uniref:hypothetical protein n=1 Tax=Paracoccus sp. TaxID=267 RepID=UPI0026DF526E
KKAPKKDAAAAADAAPAETSAPEPVLVDGYEVKPGADPALIAAETASAVAASEAITRRDADLLTAYLDLGRFASSVAPLFRSTKIYGAYLADKIPASQSLDPALRSNCKWLWEALNVPAHDARDLLTVLGVNRLEDYKSQNPTVIRREYTAAQKAAEKARVAEEAGVSVDDLTARERAERAESEAKTAADFDAAIARLVDEAGHKATKVAAAKFIADLIATAIATNTKRADIVAAIISQADA